MTPLTTLTILRFAALSLTAYVAAVAGLMNLQVIVLWLVGGGA